MDDLDTAPLGTILPWPGAKPVPAGFLRFDGSGYARSDYPELWERIHESDTIRFFWTTIWDGMISDEGFRTPSYAKPALTLIIKAKRDDN